MTLKSVRNVPMAIFCAALAAALPVFAVEFETPTAITGATVIPAPGEKIENATILIEGDRIVAIGVDIDVPSYANIIDATGLYAYAGFIDAATHLGIKEEGPGEDELKRLRGDEQDVSRGPRTGMQQANRQGIWPHLTIYDVYEEEPEGLEAHRKAGFTAALVSPQPNILGGKGDVVQLGGKSIRASIVAPTVTQIVGPREALNGVSYRNRQYPGSPMGVVALIRQTYLDAEWYRARHAQYRRYPAEVDRPVVDPVLEGMAPLLDRREMWIYLANEPNEIHHALDLANELNQRVAILGGTEAWKVADRLAKENVPVIVSLDWDDKPLLAPKASKKETEYTTVSWNPEFEKDFFEPIAVREARITDWTEHVNNLHALVDAGVTVAVTSRDAKDAAELWSKIDEALEHELDAESLLAALTLGPAEIFGLSNRLGALAKGYLANVTLLTSPIEEEDRQVRHVFIDGEQFSFDVTAPGDEASEDEPEEEKDESEDETPEDRHAWDAELPADREKPIETDGDIVLRNASVITVTEGTHHDTDILVIDGRIREIGHGIAAPEDATEIDLTGHWVMPGIIDPHSHMAVTGINEWTQSISAEVRQSDVIDHTQQAIHRALAGGVTTIHTMHGSANTIGGQNAVLKLKYNTSPAEMLVSTGPRLVKFALGENVTRSRPTPRFPNSRMGVESVMRHAFNAALEYQREWQEYAEATARGEVTEIPREDIRLTALSDILNGDIWVHTHCYRADEMLRLLAVAEDYGIRISTLQHVLEGYRVAPEMYAHGVAGSTFSDWWSYKKEAFDAIPYNAAMMMREGVITSLNSDSAELIRHLNLEAAKMMRFGGLTANEALRLITINPAIQIGLDDRIGSIEVGKDGDFAIFTAHPLDTFAKNVMTVVEGEVYFQYPDHPFDGSAKVDPDVPEPPRGLMQLEELPSSDFYAIVGGTVHPVSGPVIAGGTVLIRDGKIAAVGEEVSVPSDAQVVDATGLHVYPGMINAVSQLGLIEISGLEQTVDARELGLFQPELRSLSAINPHSEHLPVSYCEGITTTNVLPSGGVISGRSSVVQLHGWTLPEMLRAGETGLIVDLPVLPERLDEDDRKKRIDDHRKLYEDTEAFLRRAQHYVKVKATPGAELVTDVRLEALAPYVRGEKPVFFRANSYKAILQALNFADAFDLKPIIVGGGEAWKAADRLAESEVPVIITSIFDRPTGRYDRFDAFYTNAARLEEAGVPFAIATDGAEFARQLPLHAGFAVAHGLSEEAGLRAVTLSAAEILGIADAIGSLETGKVADVIITTGSPLQASTRTIGMFMAGDPIELTSLHEENYETFSNRPSPDLPLAEGLRGPPPMRAEYPPRPDTD